jgi:hypothetical protein
MQIVPLEAAHLFELNAAILGWLLAAVQPKKQLPRHQSIILGKFSFRKHLHILSRVAKQSQAHNSML